MENTANWAIVISGNRKYIGNVVAGGDLVSPSSYVTLNPCLEYYSDPVQAQTPNGRVEIVGKTRVVCPFDHTLAPVPVSLFMTGICYLKRMASEDRRDYERMVEETCRNIEAQRVKRTTGIVITETLPKGEVDASTRCT